MDCRVDADEDEERVDFRVSTQADETVTDESDDSVEAPVKLVVLVRWLLEEE